jgi:deoxyribose-phosphate aldolase
MSNEYIFTDALYKEVNFEKRIEYIKYKLDSLNLQEIPLKAKISPIVVLADLTQQGIFKHVDLTAVKPTTTIKDVEMLCAKAKEKQCFGVCVNQLYIPDVKKLLEGSQILTVPTIDFPLGSSLRESKTFQAIKALEAGADELDMVINMGFLKSGRYIKVYEEIKDITEVAREKTVKVIIETCFLKEEEKVVACLLAKKAGAAFVKTSTGFGPSGANVEDIKLMRSVVGPKMGIKASGGIKDFEIAKSLIQAGADRIGTSLIF